MSSRNIKWRERDRRGSVMERGREKERNNTPNGIHYTLSAVYTKGREVKRQQCAHLCPCLFKLHRSLWGRALVVGGVGVAWNIFTAYSFVQFEFYSM